MRELAPNHKEKIRDDAAPPHELLMLGPEIAYRTFAGRSANFRADQRGKEIVVFEDGFGVHSSYAAALARAAGRPSSRSRIGIAALQATFIAVTAALFIAWVAISR
jgi:hypothetical protein